LKNETVKRKIKSERQNFQFSLFNFPFSINFFMKSAEIQVRIKFEF
jgi:hypothetical protein